MRTVVFDLEIQKCIVPDVDRCTDTDRAMVAAGNAVHGWGQAHTAGISSGVVYEIEARRYHIFGHTAPEHAELAALLRNADQVVGFNHWNFDYGLLAHTLDVPLDQITDVDAEPGVRDYDLLQMIWAGHGARDFRKGNGLDAVARATLGPVIGGKNGDGAHAPQLYQAGQYGALLNYNLRDVELTARLYEFWREHKYLITGGGLVTPMQPRRWFPR